MGDRRRQIDRPNVPSSDGGRLRRDVGFWRGGLAGPAVLRRVNSRWGSADWNLCSAVRGGARSLNFWFAIFLIFVSESHKM